MQDFKKLEVWQLAHVFVVHMYRLCDRRFSRYPGLRSQTLRAARSIAANIAEGSGGEDAEFRRYLGHALRSSKEVENDLLLARDLKLILGDEFDFLDARLGVLRSKLIALIRRIRGS
jgi:four helix bundle protein